jgi:hypothetical protein
MAKSIPKLGDMKPPRPRKKGKQEEYKRERNPAAEAFARAESLKNGSDPAALAGTVRTFGESYSTRDGRVGLSTPTPLRTTEAAAAALAVKPAQKSKRIARRISTELTSRDLPYRNSTDKGSGAYPDVAPSSEKLASLFTNTNFGDERVAQVLRHATEMHRLTVLHGSPLGDADPVAHPHTVVGGVAYHGASRDESGFAVDPRQIGAMRADGTRVGERPRHISEIIRGISPVAERAEPATMTERAYRSESSKGTSVGAPSEGIIQPAADREVFKPKKEESENKPQ